MDWLGDAKGGRRTWTTQADGFKQILQSGWRNEAAQRNCGMFRLAPAQRFVPLQSALSNTDKFGTGTKDPF